MSAANDAVVAVSAANDTVVAVSAANDTVDAVSAVATPTGVSTVGAPTPAPREEPGGSAIDPRLARVITRVAHREYLVDASRPTALTRPGRHRPAGTAHVTRGRTGTTARKVTRSR